MLQLLTSVCLAVFWCGLAFGQTPAPRFEVASIRPVSGTMTPADLISGRTPFHIDAARVDFAGVSMESLLEWAYGVDGVDADRISGPKWMADQRFDILAKIPEGANKDQWPDMLRALLAERFKLAVHHEQKIVSAYALVVGKQGQPKLHESAGGDPSQKGCNGGAGGHHTCRMVSMEGLAYILTQTSRMNATAPQGADWWGLDRPVVDRTGLKGIYDFTMDYGRVGGAGRGGPDAAEPVTTERTMVPITDAIHALGLALEPIKHTIGVIVVDHLERLPTEN